LPRIRQWQCQPLPVTAGLREKIVSSVSDSSYDTVKCLGNAEAFFYPASSRRRADGGRFSR